MKKPVLLDLFCGAGGATKGYQDAGFHVIGVDIAPHPNYCGDEFFQGDALDMFYKVARTRPIAAVHASPPCQASTTLTKGTNKGRTYPQLIPATRRMLSYLDIPTVIENVQGSDLRKDLVLCGEMFGLQVIRHRYFEVSNVNIAQPAHQPHRGRVAGYRHGAWYDGPYFAVYGSGGGKGSIEQWQDAMGIHWTDVRKEIAEAIPPAYTKFIGNALMEQIGSCAA